MEAPFNAPGGNPASLADFKVLDRLHERWKTINNKSVKSDKSKGEDFTILQKALFKHVYLYRDVMYQAQNEDNIKQIRNLYTLHALNHVIK